MARKIGWVIMTLLSVLVGAYALVFFFLPAARPPLMQERFAAMPWAAYLHVGMAGLALAVGPFQFHARLRARFRRLHRWTGRVYVIGVILGGVSGLAFATIAQGGPLARLGFGVLAVWWLVTTVLAYRRIRAGDVAAHKRWMIRSFALTFAAVTLRIYIPLSVVLGMDFAVAYPVIAWLCWVPNLVFGEWWIRREGLGKRVPSAIPVRLAEAA